jgi:hypothetical protein
MKVQWGRWRLDPVQLTLHIRPEEREMYLIPLIKCNSSEEILDWVVQVRQKPWATGQDLSDLVEALDDLLGLEENFCGSGIDWTDGNADYAQRILDRKFGGNAVSMGLRGKVS